MTEPSASSVRDAAALIFAAERLIGDADDPHDVATAIDTLARAAKALRPNHLDDALAHVAHRARYIAAQQHGTVPSSDDPHAPSLFDDTPVVSGDVEALRSRVRGG